MNRDVKTWIEDNGIKFLQEIGIKKSYKIVDFGCGEGHYTIPLAKVVGNKGKVYGIDKDKVVLSKLKEISEKMNLKNVELVNSDTKIPLKESSVDVVLCYDVIHYEKRTKREEIYKEIYRILKPEGFFSLYPKHHKDDYPLKELSFLSLKDIIEEVEKTGFQLKEKLTKRCLHDVYYNECIILNFIPLIRR
ncbi:MAG: hypothetical protein DRI36_03275 [Caldiserica bacterium]|nr:MAG: hypothetical protein DRI36_03275 [Caldisericota bacterium]